MENWPDRTLLARGAPMVWSHGLNTRFLNMNRPSLPRITRCSSGGPRESAHSRAELGLRHRLETPIQIPIAIPSKTRLDGLCGPIHPHPKARPSSSKSPSIPIQNAFGWAVGGPRRWSWARWRRSRRASGPSRPLGGFKNAGQNHRKPVPTGETVYQYSQPANGGSDRHLNRAVDRPVR